MARHERGAQVLSPGSPGAGTVAIDQAWSVVAYGFLVSLLSSGVRFSIGPFLTPIMNDFNFTPSSLSGIVAASMLIYGFAMPFTGWLADTWSVRGVLMAGVLVMGVSLMTIATTQSAEVFSFAFAVAASLGFAATSHVTLSPAVSRWFVRRRAFAMTCVAAGAMGGIAIITPVASMLIAWIGWRGAYMALAGMALIVLLPMTWWIMRQRPPELEGSTAADGGAGSGRTSADTGPVPFTGVIGPRRAMATAPYWFLAIGFFGCGFSMNLLGTHGVPMLEHRGFDTMTASFGVGLIGLVSLFGSVTLGALADRLGRPLFLALIYLVRGLGFLGLIAVGYTWQLYAVATIGGLAWAGSAALTSAITADLYGVRTVGTLYGILFIGHQIGAALGSFMGGWTYENLNSYQLPFTVAAALLILGAFLSYRLREARVVSRAAAVAGAAAQAQG